MQILAHSRDMFLLTRLFTDFKNSRENERCFVAPRIKMGIDDISVFPRGLRDGSRLCFSKCGSQKPQWDRDLAGCPTDVDV